MAKKHISLYIDEEIINESKQIGLNISRICENALREAVERLKGNTDKHLFANINVKCWARSLV
ncbi:MAG: type II toxin-antitoxin system CcdA family antitoxin, partial [Thermoproteales archaeon]|nr:type II toxin-antitoxin system CcdA family antitoxin [Thermoproteales archaeon]